MSRYTGPTTRINRRFGMAIFPANKAFERRTYPPGQHGPTYRRKVSDYGEGLLEKQKLRMLYSLTEKQFRNLFEKAKRKQGVTGENFLTLLETRLDNVVYRLGFASTRSQARQLVSHCHFLLNNKKCNYPSASLNPGDVIRVRDKSKKMDIILSSIKRIKGDIDLPWLELDKANMSGTFLSVPDREEMQVVVNEQLIVELYSK